MDILTHTLSGVAVGTVVSSFAETNTSKRVTIILLSGFAGALPDFDAISLWSKFDSTIGKFFHLTLTGREIYSAKRWYSHHAFLHSLFAGFLIAFLIGTVIFFLTNPQKNRSVQGFSNSLVRNKLLMIGFLGGFSLHLLEDMPTPAATWGGVNFFWPSRHYIGGTGEIWWWNNYDLFLIVVFVILLNLVLHGINKMILVDLKKWTVGVFVVGFSLAIVQIKTRPYDFSYSGHTKKYLEFEKKSKAVQKKILGEKIFLWMEKFDNSLGVYF